MRNDSFDIGYEKKRHVAPLETKNTQESQDVFMKINEEETS
jgi:hypothetical protein